MGDMLSDRSFLLESPMTLRWLSDGVNKMCRILKIYQSDGVAAEAIGGSTESQSHSAPKSVSHRSCTAGGQRKLSELVGGTAEYFVHSVP